MANTIRTSCTLLAFFSGFLLLTLAPTAAAQDVVPAPEPRPSPLALTKMSLDDGTYIKIYYSSPRKRGREIFGGLEPYGEVWRLGANEATEITITKPILFGGTDLPAGTYSLFAIPEQDKWTVIVNENLGQWGAFSYSADADVARIEVPVERTPKVHEAFTISLKKDEDEKNGRLEMVWDQTQVTVPIKSGSSR